VFFSSAHSILTIFLLTQSRAQNIPLFALFQIQYFALSQLSLTPAQLSITSLILGQASFFALGNSNAISSIDLSNAYNGVTNYNVAMVGILLFLSNWAGPVWWAVGGLSLAADADAKRREHSRDRSRKEREAPASVTREPVAAKSIGDEGDSFETSFALMTLFVTGSLVAIMVACTMLRTHLFIWTVFSPKYLYSMAWSLGFHFCITLGLSGALWALSSVEP
jgi:ethanolaminephosphotransferase